MSKRLRRIALGIAVAAVLSLAAASAASANAGTNLLSNLAYYTVNDGSSFCRYPSPTSVSINGGGTASQTRNSDGTVSLSISNAGGYADNGFYESVSTLGKLSGYTIQGTGDVFGTNLWFDTNTSDDNSFNGPLFSWTQGTCAGGGDTYSAGGDSYSLGPSSTSTGGGGQSLTVDGSSTFALTCNGTYQSVTLSQLQSGYCSGIDGTTPVAVWVGITGGSGSTLNTTIGSAYIPATCTATGFYRDGINLTAAVDNPGTTPVTGQVGAYPCNIGVYYGSGTSGSVSWADVSGANYYGVVVAGAAVDVSNSTIHNIGENPFNGTQHGVGVFYTTLNGKPDGSNDSDPIDTPATGTLSGSTIKLYQKNGVVVNGSGASATVSGNTVTGNGMINYIAQNGIEIARGASALVKGNSVSGNWYTGTQNVTACGLLFYQASGVKQQANTLFANQTNVCNGGRGGGNASG